MNIEQEIFEIKERNIRVETDKAWEVSWTRRISIALPIYIIFGVWLAIIKDTNPWLKALVPSFGYLVSTLSLPIVKTIWVKLKKSSL